MKPPTFVTNFSSANDIEKMSYVPLGKTGLLISKLGLGSAAFGGEHFYGNYNKKEAEEVIVSAIRKGINYIDTAPHYGHGVAETVLGEVLKRVPRNSYYISTKVGRTGNQFNFKADAIIDSFEKSLNRLQLDFVDLLIIHDVEFADSDDVILNVTLPAVEKIIKSGRAKFVGISGYPVAKLFEIVQKSNVKIDVVLSYCRDTLIDDTLQDFLPKFQEKGVAVINAGCIGMKLLSDMKPPSWHPASEEIKKKCAEASSYCQQKGVQLGRLALYHSINQPGSCPCLVGMNDFTTLESNLYTLYNGITEEELKVLQTIKREFFTPKNRYHWEGSEVNMFRENKLYNYN